MENCEIFPFFPPGFSPWTHGGFHVKQVIFSRFLCDALTQGKIIPLDFFRSSYIVRQVFHHACLNKINRKLVPIANAVHGFQTNRNDVIYNPENIEQKRRSGLADNGFPQSILKIDSKKALTITQIINTRFVRRAEHTFPRSRVARCVVPANRAGKFHT